jgi:signal transduction histidine kinase
MLGGPPFAGGWWPRTRGTGAIRGTEFKPLPRIYTNMEKGDGDRMDLRAHLTDVLFARLAFTLAVASPVLWVRIEQHGARPVELVVIALVLMAANLPVLALHFGGGIRLVAAVTVAIDLVLVTAAILLAEGGAGTIALFYVWPIIFSSAFLPGWAPYATAGAASAASIGVWTLLERGVLNPSGGDSWFAGDWSLDLLCLQITAFLLTALLAGRLAATIGRAARELRDAQHDMEEQLRSLQRSNARLQVLGESSRLFLRHHSVDGLMSEAVRQSARSAGIAAGFALVRSPATGEHEEKGLFDVSAELARRLRDHGLLELADDGALLCVTADDPRRARLLKDLEHEGLHGLVVAPLEAKAERLGLVCLLFRRGEPVDGDAARLLQSQCGLVAIVLRTIRDTEELGRKNRELTHLDELKSDFMATMSHELRTPLTSIIGYSDMLLSGMTGELNEKQQGFVQSILNGGEQLLNLINDILDLTKIEAGRLELNFEAVDLRAALLNVLPVVKPRAQEKRIRISTFLPTELPPLWADPSKLNQVLLNLLTNGVKYTHENGTVSVEARLADDDKVEIWVNDTGIGISAEDQQRVFQRFTQIDSSATRTQGGTGLGLAIARELVELHGGTLRLQSKLGKGSSFIFTVPISGQPTDPLAAGKIS